MATISFKADTELRNNIGVLAKQKGINVSAYIKLLLTRDITDELSRITENGMTVAEEMRLLHVAEHGEFLGPFSSVKSLMRALKNK